jgi:beta-lactamase class A
VAHKTGTIGTVANDVGIITLPGGGGHLVIAGLVKGSTASVRVRDQAIAAAVGLVYRRMVNRPGSPRP